VISQYNYIWKCSCIYENANRIIISGGESKNDLLLQIISDVFNKKVYLSNKNSTAYGASLIGLNMVL